MYMPADHNRYRYLLLLLAALALLAGLAGCESPAQTEPLDLVLTARPDLPVLGSTAVIPAPVYPSALPEPAVPVAKTSAAQPASPVESRFDYFILALSWSPDYCASNGSDDPQQCSLGKKLGFVLHGLWPQYEQGYPSNCSTQKLPASVKARYAGLYPNDSLFSHEWEKHGTCTGLAPGDYLALTKQIKESVVIPEDFLSPAKPFRTTAAELKQAFVEANPGTGPEDFEVYCSGSGRYLKELYACFTREGAAAGCGADVHKDALKSCQAADFLVRNTR